MFSKIIIIFYVILMVYFLYTNQKYNYNGCIIETNKYNILHDNILKLNPILFHDEIINNKLSNIINDNEDYFIESKSFNFQHYYDKDYINIYKNKEIIKNKYIEDLINFNFENIPNNNLNIVKKFNLTILKGNHSYSIKTSYHNVNMICILDGVSTFYLFNPKHNKEIKNKENKSIKKWGHKKIVKKNEILFIPPYWKYIQEVNKKVIQLHVDIDNIFCFIPNFFKDY